MTNRDILLSQVAGVAKDKGLKKSRNLTYTESSLIKLELVSDLMN